MDHWDERTEIIIIGSGFAGLAAAIEAAEAGAEVVILEKMKTPGGNSSISDGAVCAAGTGHQQRAGIEDSPEIMVQDMLAAGLGLNHQPLVELVAFSSAKVFEWTIDHLGVDYCEKVEQYGGHSIPRGVATHNTSGSAIIRKQLALLKKLGVEVRTRSKLTGLIRDEKGRVIGIEYLADYRAKDSSTASLKRLAGDGAIILASGGFGADIAFRTVQDPRLDETIDHTNHPGATAEGLISALKLGAAPVHLSWIQSLPCGCPDAKGYNRVESFISYSIFPAGVVVHPKTGQRFFSETADRRTRAEAIYSAAEPCIGLVDALGAEWSPKFLEMSLKAQFVRRFETLPELAQAYGLPVDRFLAGLEIYNKAVQQGAGDPLGRVFSKGLAPISQPPFYGVRVWPKIHFCMGGLRIDTTGRALDLEGLPIEGLFAAGEVSGGVHGACRLGGCAIIECLVMGRTAGKSAAGKA